jgi:methylenetetrahydrofolate reductase (NADPH)
MIDLVRFGRLVRTARRTKSPRISQVDLAKQVGVTQSFVSDLENGRLRLGPRDPEIIDKIADILGISTEEASADVTPLDPSDTLGYLPPQPPPESLSDKIQRGQFVLTMEIHPPKGVGLKRFQGEAMELKEFADAVNVTDNQRALLKLSPIASARVLLELGLEPICQIACRDRNRLCLQADILSAYVLGVRNFFIIMGDPPEIGDHPDAQPVFDLHSVQMLEVAGKLRMGFDMAGNRLNKAPRDLYLGSACNPFPQDRAVELSKMRAKLRAGAQFFQTQPVYDVKGFHEFLKTVRPLGAKVIAGYIPILDEKTLEIIREIPGIVLPEKVRDRLEKAGDIEREGMAIACDTVEGLMDIADGIHMMNISRVMPSLKVIRALRRKLGR